MTAGSPIVIAGAGGIGCYVGGCLALEGREVRFLGRPRVVEALKSSGLRVTDLESRDRTLEAARIQATDDPAVALAGAKLVLVCVKSGATAEMAGLIDRHAPTDAIVVSLQNGVGNAARIAAAMTTARTVVAGMVPFNVVLSGDQKPLRVHRATSGAIMLADRPAGLARDLSCKGLTVVERGDMPEVLWGKLLLNLNNALNALSDLPLATELSDRRWRRLLAAQMSEALAALRAAGIRPAKLAGAPPPLLPPILRLPDWLFRRVARGMLAIDPQARSSMWEDLAQHRTTEIDEFQGAIIRLADQLRLDAPLSRRVLALVREAETAGGGPPGLSPPDVDARIASGG